MISRRNIRIKVMQNLYALEALKTSDEVGQKRKINTAQQHVEKDLNDSILAFVHLLYIMQEIAGYADKDARQRAAKRLPTEQDLHVDTKLAHSQFVKTLKENDNFQIRVKDALLEKRTDREFIKLLYGRLIKTEAYENYVATEKGNKKADIEILKEFFAVLLFDDEDFEQFMDDLYLQWQDDISMMEILISNFLKKPKNFNFRSLVSHEKREYATELIRTVIEKKDYCREWIKPRLKNWDPDRVAIIDMLLLHMGVCEFLYFPTIPPRVTINEYIDLAKEYSTEQSGQFINGVLDNILKKLKNEGKLNKVERAH